MTKQFQTVGLVARRPEPVIAETVQAVCTTLENLGADLVLAEATASELNIACKSYRTCARAELAALCDLIVVVGGDGSHPGSVYQLNHAREAARDDDLAFFNHLSQGESYDSRKSLAEAPNNYLTETLPGTEYRDIIGTHSYQVYTDTTEHVEFDCEFQLSADSIRTGNQ